MLLPKELKYAAIAGGVAVFGLIFGWVLFPVILKGQLKKEMALSKKTDVRKMWETIPFALEFKVYLFNYTNAEEVQKGAKPIIKEVGPYHFDEWKEKVEIEDHEEDDTITYKKKDAFYFNPELSAPGLTGEEIVVMPHVFMLGMALTVQREKPAMLNMVGKAMNGIFDNPPDIFMRVKALDILFRGIIINCARTEFAPKATCTALKKEGVNGLVLEPNNQFRFSIFGTTKNVHYWTRWGVYYNRHAWQAGWRSQCMVLSFAENAAVYSMRNNTIDPHVITVKRGIQNVMDVGQVVAVDGKLEQTVWRDACNEYQGTDGTVFPPFLTENDRLQSFSTDLCRSFKPWYQKKTSYRGIKTNRYIANIGNLAEDPELQCFCPEPGKCPPKGLMDLIPCIKAPMYASMPHFLDSDPALLDNVKGLNPDVNQHGIEIDFEPISGTPMVAKQRIQFNIQLLKTDKIDLFKDLSGDIVPLFWIDEGLALNKTFVNMLKHQLFIPKRVVGVLRWWMVSFGSLGAVIGIVFHFRDHIMRLAVSGDSKVSKVTPEEAPEQKDISVIGQPAQEPAKINI